MHRLLLPGRALVAEVAYQFPLLGVYADDGVPLTDEFVPTTVNVSELLVAVTWGRLRAFLMIHTQPEVHLSEESAHGVSTHLNSTLNECDGDPLCGLTRPLQAADRLTSRFVLHQLLDLLDDFRRFFPRAGDQHPPFGYD